MLNDGIRDDVNLLLLQLADSAFPTGGFVHSGGLEAASVLGLTTDLFGWFCDSLENAGWSALPLASAGFSAHAVADAAAETWLINHVAHRASRAQGQGWATTIAAVFPSADFSALKAACRHPGRGHFAPTFGHVCALLDMPLAQMQRLFLFLHLRGQVSTAIRLGRIGPLEAQRLQVRLTPVLEAVWATCATLRLDDLATTAPLHDLAHGHHDRLYSRLFTT